MGDGSLSTFLPTPPPQLPCSAKSLETTGRNAHPPRNAPRGGAGAPRRRSRGRRACAVEGLKQAGDWYACECVRGGGVGAERGTTTGAGRRGRGDAPRRRQRRRRRCGRWGWCLESPEQRILVLLPQQRGCRARSEDAVPLCPSPFFFFFFK